MQNPGTSEDEQDIEATDIVYCDEVELFDEDAQSAYLFQLRTGVPARMAARNIRFTPRAVREFRKRSSIFDEACEESVAEADEAVEYEARKALQFHEPWAVKLLAERQGWKREAQQAKGGASGLPQIEGNPMERIVKLTAMIESRGTPTAKIAPNLVPTKQAKKPRIPKRKPMVIVPAASPADLDVSLDD